ncbi:hypothetical protein ISTM_303 [Insectomime virus]|nr:hypothetical protein ISTM_303 [Insectomime virus]
MQRQSSIFLFPADGSSYRVSWSKEGKETGFICKRTMTFGKRAYFNLLREMDRKYLRNSDGLYVVHSRDEAIKTFLDFCVVFESDILIETIKRQKIRLEKLELVSASIGKKLARQKHNLFLNYRSCEEGRSERSFELFGERELWRKAIEKTAERYANAKSSEDSLRGQILLLEEKLRNSGYKTESHCLVSDVIV